MHYYIDGYNLLFRTMGSSIDDLQSHRNSLIASLNVKVASLKLDVTLVFDSQYLEGEGSRSHYKHLEICFTPRGITADEFILRQLQFCRFPQRETVITSDKDLAYKARNYTASTQSIEEFLGWLNKRYKKKESHHPFVKAAPPKLKMREQKSLESLNVSVVDEVIEAPPVIKAEAVKVHSKGSIEFYLAHFEEQLHSLKAPEARKNLKSHPRVKEKKIAPKIEYSHLSEDERWLKIFLDRLTQSDD